MLTPGKDAFPGREAAGRRRLSRRRHLPLCLGRQAPPRPAAVGLGLVVVDVAHRLVGLELDPPIEGAALPAASNSSPVHGARRVHLPPPGPAVIASQRSALITTIIDDGGKPGLRLSRTS